MTSHAITRGKERYGLHLSPQGIEKLKSQVTSGKAILMGGAGEESPTRKVYMAKMGGVVLRFVYDTKSKAVVTILPSDGPMKLRKGRPQKSR